MRIQFSKISVIIALFLLLSQIFFTPNFILAQPLSPSSKTQPPAGSVASETASVPTEIVHHPSMGPFLPLFSGLPFLGILLSIALFPLLAPHFWEKHYPKVSAFWALIIIIPLLISFKGLAFYELKHILLVDYIPFIILLWGLFTVSGGILLRGTLLGTPALNTLFLFIGTIIASWMGTTGASMLLIRPVIRSNAPRKYKIHIIIFFIFLVANIGGALTPLGDPPLFLGFLHGVPFFWTMQLIPIMGLVSILLLIIFFLLDSVLYHREKLPPSTEKIPLKLEGYHNFLFLLGIIGAVLMSGKWQAGEIDVWGVKVAIQDLTRDGIILLMGILSVLFTKNITRQDNHFTWGPIKEVAYLFAGIFVTILPVLDMLRAGSSGALAFIVNAVKEPFHYYWAAGGLSSFLDNAPTYLTYFNLALGRLGLPESMITPILTGAPIDPAYQAQAATFVFYLKAISAGAVFFGANTYIGNAPNFMVRSIALENDIKMPSFFGYMLWSIGILIPLFILTTFIFFI